MTTELTLLAWTLLLAFVYMFASVIVRTGSPAASGTWAPATRPAVL